jgi:hypothetical protein
VPQLFIYNTLSLHCPRPYPKRAAGLALINAIGGTSNTWSSYLWANPPRFFAGFGMVVSLSSYGSQSRFFGDWLGPDVIKRSVAFAFHG